MFSTVANSDTGLHWISTSHCAPSSQHSSQPNVIRNNTPSDTTDFRPDRIGQIMANWKLRFTGKGYLSVDDFIYRAKALTRQTLEGNFELLA